MTTFRQLGPTVGVAAVGIVFGAPALHYMMGFHSAQVAAAVVAWVAGLGSIMLLPRTGSAPAA